MRPIHVCLCCLFLLAACAPSGTETSAGTSTPGSTPYQAATPSPTHTLLPGLTDILLPTSTPFIYIIEAGDTLDAIAARYGVSLVDLMAANPGVQPTLLVVGMELVIPTGTLPPAEQVPTAVPAPVRQAGCWAEGTGGAWCFALVENTFAEPLENLSVQFTLLGEDGQEIASQVTFAPLNLLPAGASMPLGVFFPAPVPGGVQVRAQLLTANRILPGDVRYLPVMLENTLVSLGASQRSAQVSGKAMLTVLDGLADTLWVLATAYNEDGNVVGFRRWDADTPLAGGETVEFSFLLSSMGPVIDRVEFLSEAKP